MPKKPYLVTTQPPQGVRHRHIVWTYSTIEAISTVLAHFNDPNTYTSAKPASADDCIAYAVFQVRVAND